MQKKQAVILALALAMSPLALRAEEAAKADAAKPAEAKPAAAAEAAKPAAGAEAAKPAEAAPVAKNDAPGSVKKGNDLVDAGKFEEAVAYYEGIGEQTTANGHSKREPWRLIGLSKAYIELGKFDKAAENAQKAIDIDPKLGAAWNNLGSAQAQQGKRAEAIETYN